MNFQNQKYIEESLPQSARERHLRDYLGIFAREKTVLFISVFAVTLATALYTFLSKPVYEATTMVLIDAKSKQGSMPFMDMLGAGNATKITNEIETLKSRSMMEAAAGALLKRVYVEEGSKTVMPFVLGAPDARGLASFASVRQVALRLQKAMDFSPVKESDIIKITVRSTDPREAVLVANTYTESYSDRNVDISRQKSKAVREFLQEQVSSKQKSLAENENALQSYMHSSGLVSLDDETKKKVEQMAQLEASRDAIEVEITYHSRTVTSLKEELAKQEPNVAKVMGESNDAYIRLLQEQLAKLEVQRDLAIAQNSTMRGQDMYSGMLKDLDGQVASLRKTLQERTQTYLKSVLPGGDRKNEGQEGSAGFLAQIKQKIIEQQIELDGLTAKHVTLANVIAEYERQFNLIPKKSLDLAKLQRSRLSSEKLYLMVEEKFNEAAITERSELGYVTVMDPAAVPDDPVSPKVGLNLMLGFLLGIGLGVGIVLFRSTLDVTIRTPEELKRYGFSVLSTVSKMEWKEPKGAVPAVAPLSGKTYDIHLISISNPYSPIAESFRHLSTNVQHSHPDKPLKSVMFTSAGPGEGKTTLISNLAITLAQADKRVLLVDTDLRRPTIHTFFNLRKDPGLSDLLFGVLGLETVVNRNIVENLDIICSGKSLPNPSKTIGSKKIQEFLEHAALMYDYVLFDSPPLLAVNDAAVLSGLVEGTILVISAGKTRIDELERCTEVLAQVGGNVLGVVLNNFDARKAYGGYKQNDLYTYSNYGYSGNPAGNGKGDRKTALRG